MPIYCKNNTFDNIKSLSIKVFNIIIKKAAKVNIRLLLLLIIGLFYCGISKSQNIDTSNLKNDVEQVLMKHGLGNSSYQFMITGNETTYYFTNDHGPRNIHYVLDDISINEDGIYSMSDIEKISTEIKDIIKSKDLVTDSIMLSTCIGCSIEVFKQMAIELPKRGINIVDGGQTIYSYGYTPKGLSIIVENNMLSITVGSY